jgi:uncharacterized protein
MTNLRRPFRLNVGFIIHEEVGSNYEFPFDFDKAKFGEDFELRHFTGLMTIGRTPQGLLATGSFKGETTLDCVRCLKSFNQPMTWEMTELFAFNEKSVSESGLIVPEDAQIDLEPLIREYALLEIPINPICEPDCKGLCPECGQNLNIKDCGHHPDFDGSSFSELKQLLKK